MTSEDLFKPIQQQLEAYVMEWQTPETNRFDALLSSDHLFDAVHVLKNSNQFYLIAITGMDQGTDSNTLEVLYHFAMQAIVVTLRVSITHTQATIPSICLIYTYASPFERETSEMFGITFVDAPDTSRLFLPEDWTDGVYPLRKDAQLDGGNDDQK